MSVLPAGRRLRAAAAIGVATLLLAGVAVPASAATGTGVVRICASTPFRSDPAAHVWYRIPAIVATGAGALLAFAERRGSTGAASDTSDTDVVVARSTTSGCSWSTPRVIAAHGTDTVGNPAPVVDRTTGKVLLLTVDRPKDGRGVPHLQRSADDGRTWTPYARSAMDTRAIPGWIGGLTGPGHAVQLAVGPHVGRIVVPVGSASGTTRIADDLISDDDGATWRVGFTAAGQDQRQEGTIAQLSDGRLWISYHRRDPSAPIGRNRIAALSSDGGETLDAAFADLALPTVSVQAASLALTGTHAGMLLVSSPGTKDTRVRRVMTIFVSRTDVPGASWTRYPVTLDDTPAAYSDLVQLDDATVGVLYETGRTTWKESIAFRSVRISALTAGATVRSRQTVSMPSRISAGSVLAVRVRVHVPGTASPAGSVRVVVANAHRRRTATLPLQYPGRGLRVVVLRGLPAGRYTVTTTYSGSPRIRPVTTTRALRVG